MKYLYANRRIDLLDPWHPTVHQTVQLEEHLKHRISGISIKTVG